jgi:lipoprotein-anchoring transpeptidase ErfK/SrfK
MRRAALTTILAAAATLATAMPAPAAAPARQPGRVTLDALGGIAAHNRVYVLKGDNVTLVGHVTPYVAGQSVRVRITSPHRKRTLVHAKIRKGNREGTFQVRFRTRRTVVYGIYVRHDRTSEQSLFATRAAAAAVMPGSRMAIILLKQGMRALGYPAGNGTAMTGEFTSELLAFRKVNDMERIYTPDQKIYEMVFTGRGAFKLRYPNGGKHVEADISRQVIALAQGDKVVAVYPTSSGSPATPTVLGHFHFYLKAPGTNAKGMYMSNYFIGNYAIHGYPYVPPYNASHGCLRIPNADAITVFDQIDLGESIWVYL